MWVQFLKTVGLLFNFLAAFEANQGVTLMSHKKVTIALILRIWLRLNSKGLKLDQDMKKITLGFYQ